ncbi:MAG: MoxR-like ATPase in aerotolerance operon [Candidatus Ozemobacter sibiricus]|uniref:MoxR-like ATPase in aerotolerance operon n=1 Tax=Candidatus Ozemobacter sibiricus TaxID=2268124 RepID=A0A367ZTM4_9BACT|nr:MAG: MoxR-like ATPase in aerotolerance operon [Candidatus Ozemobacter sibiricus]
MTPDSVSPSAVPPVPGSDATTVPASAPPAAPPAAPLVAPSAVAVSTGVPASPAAPAPASTPTRGPKSGEPPMGGRPGLPRVSLDRLRREIGKVIVGNQEVVDQVLITLFAGGHALLEGVPGLGKTLLVRTIASVLQQRFRRIQFTPDLMPADIIGTKLIREDEQGRRSFVFEPGPLFANLILADEINRATAKTQSALLEAMAEGTVTSCGETYALTPPFFVLATQNPIEMEGTYPLPEAQVDRFMFKILVELPSREMLEGILERTTGNEQVQLEPVMSGEEIVAVQKLVRDVPIARHLREAIASLILATQPKSANAPPPVKRYVAYGSSPRGLQAVALAAKSLAFLKGQNHVSFEEIKAVARPALRHRLIMNFEGEAEGISSDEIIGKILAQLETQVSLGKTATTG